MNWGFVVDLGLRSYCIPCKLIIPMQGNLLRQESICVGSMLVYLRVYFPRVFEPSWRLFFERGCLNSVAVICGDFQSGWCVWQPAKKPRFKRICVWNFDMATENMLGLTCDSLGVVYLKPLWNDWRLHHRVVVIKRYGNKYLRCVQHAPKNTRKKAWHCNLANMTFLLVISRPQLHTFNGQKLASTWYHWKKILLVFAVLY